MPADPKALEGDFVQLARIALAGRPQDIQFLLHRIAKRYRAGSPEFSESLLGLIRESPTRSSPLRRQADVPMPVDTDSRLQLLRIEERPALDADPVMPPKVKAPLDLLIRERRNPESLQRAGLEPTKTGLFTGPPGVGKTMAARWLARELNRPLVVLDLAAVMSSYLGRTGTNLRHVLDYAKSINCVLLLDELDAIAKRRDDRGEIGELKRLVTVLIQQIDDWPSTGLLLAATNHPDLLDPAIWRRFEIKVDFPLPGRDAIAQYANNLLTGHAARASEWADILAIALAGKSFSDIQMALLAARRAAAVEGVPLDDVLARTVDPEKLPKQDRIALAARLVESGVMSQRKAHDLTGVSRDTIRGRGGKRVKLKAGGPA